MDWLKKLLPGKQGLAFGLRYFVLFLMLFISIAMAALLNIISSESNPFFYANF
jgi:hypothetical protein